MPTRMNIEPPRYEEVLNWLQGATEENPKQICKLGNRSNYPYFLAWLEDGRIRLRAHPNARPAEHIIDYLEWEGFRTFRNGLTLSQQNLAASYRNHPWTRNRLFYPAIPAISYQFQEDLNAQ